jgi:RimJ/RimL family protein N-acetyltransferase
MPMALPRELRTERLLLRRWRLEDRDAFAAINADSRVMEHFPGLMSREQSDALVERIETHFENHGYAQWAVEIPSVAPFAGFVGLNIPRYETRFTPCVEVGWRLAAEFWGHGYATEGARAALAFGFNELKLDEIVSYTVPANVRSRRVMERIGMRHDVAGDFDHPLLPEGHPLRRHVLYRIGRPSMGEKSRFAPG